MSKMVLQFGKEGDAMARPPKCRKICHMPQTLEFAPVPMGEEKDPVMLTLDEYETIRLMDREGLSQEQCCQRMQIARTTVQKIYEGVRKKLADALVEGRPLRIGGGSYRLCNGRDASCQDGECYKQEFLKLCDMAKGVNMMRIAVTYEDGEIFQHFGHTEAFKVYDVEEGKIVNAQVVSTNGSGHGALAEVLHILNADVLICGGIGGGARMALDEMGIKLYGGVSGNADEAVEAFVAGALAYNPDVRCDHHDHQHPEGHTCGSHGCGGEHHCH